MGITEALQREMKTEVRREPLLLYSRFFFSLLFRIGQCQAGRCISSCRYGKCGKREKSGTVAQAQPSNSSFLRAFQTFQIRPALDIRTAIKHEPIYDIRTAIKHEPILL